MDAQSGQRKVALLVAVAVSLAAGGLAVAAVETAASAPITHGVDCPESDDGTVFRTDSGLEVRYDHAVLEGNPYVNASTLSFSNLTVRATDNASVRVEAATDQHVCVADVEPTESTVTLRSDAGPTVVVGDGLRNLSYGAVEYAPTRSTTDLAYSADATSEITITASQLQPGREIQALDVDGGRVLDETAVNEDRTVALWLPAGTRAVDIRLAPTTPVSATPHGSTDGHSTNDSRTDERATTTAASTDATPSPNASVQSPSSGPFGWSDELIDYQPTTQTQHVGAFLPVTVLLWLLVLWLLFARENRATLLLALVLVTASVRATSDLLQVLFDGFAGVETPLVALNLVLELVLAVAFFQFAAAYANETRFRTRRARWALGGVVTVSTGAILTNPIHGLVFADVAVAGGPFTYVDAGVGPAGLALFFLNMSLVITGGGLVLRTFLASSTRTVWRPVAVVGAGLCLAVFFGVLSVLGLGPVDGYDYTAAGVNYFVLLTSATLLSHGLQRLEVSGQRSIIAELEDPVLILDDAWTVVEYNDAANRLLPDVESGTSFDDLLADPIARPSVGETVTRELSSLVDPSAIDSATGPGTMTDGGENDQWMDPPTRSAAGDTGTGNGTGDPLADVDTQSAPGGAHLEPSAAAVEDEDETAKHHGNRRERRHYVVTATTVTMETTDLIGYTVQFSDVTPLKRRLLHLETRNDQLDRFATAITEDLLTPLRTASQHRDHAVSALESAAGPDAIDRSRFAGYVAEIEAALGRMAETIEDVLELARGSDLETDPRPVDFETVVQSAWEAVGPTGPTLRLESSGVLTADPDHLRRLLSKLFGNSVEHGGEDITVHVRLNEDGFTVADDGPGVSDAVQQTLFEPGATTTDDASGLGLAIAEQRAHAQGWEIELDPDHDGARFVVTGCDVSPDGGGDRS